MARIVYRRGSLAALGAIALASAEVAIADSNISYFYTGQTGAQVQVDTFHTQYWSVTPGQNLTNFMGGRFKMKAGPQTVENVTFVFFAGSFQDYLDSTYTSLMSVTRTAAEVGYADYTFIDFFANDPLTLTAGTLYTGVLWSDAPQAQSRAFFIKDSFEFIDPPSGGGAAPVPPAALIGAAGLLLVGRGRRR